MSINRILVLVGSLTAAIGAAGLTFYGLAPVAVFQILTVRILADGCEPLPGAMGHFLPAALCAALLVAGVLALCAGSCLPSRRQSMAPAGRILMVLSGVIITSAAMLIGWALFATHSYFHVIATYGATPRSREVQELIDWNVPLMTTGYWILLAGLICSAMSGIIGFQKQPTERCSAIVQLLPVSVAGLAGLCYIVLSFLCWQHSLCLEVFFATTGGTPRPTEFANYLSGILATSLFNCLLLIAIGIAVAISGLLSPRPHAS